MAHRALKNEVLRLGVSAWFGSNTPGLGFWV